MGQSCCKSTSPFIALKSDSLICLDELRNVSVIFTCWLRTMTSGVSMSADLFVDLVLRYYFIKFEWDPLCKHKEIALLDDNQTFHHTAYGWKTVVSKLLLSGDTLKSASMELTIDGVPEKWSSKPLCLMIGFVDSSAVDDIRMNMNLGLESTLKCAFLSETEGFGMCVDSKWKGDYAKNGDRIRLTFDFVNRTCLIFYNDERVGFISENLPNGLYVAASPFGPANKLIVKATEFKVNHK